MALRSFYWAAASDDFGFVAAILGSAVILSLLILLGRWGERDRRRLAGLCINCGYDLTGNVSGTCPECGAPVGRGTA